MPIPPFTLGYPQDGSTLGQSKSTIRGNIDGTIQTLSIDHFNANQTNTGKHTQVQLPVSASDFAAVLGQGTLYSKVFGVGSDAQLFWRFAGATVPLQLTNNFISTIATPGYIPLMGGLLLQWGFNTVASGTKTLFGTHFTSGGVDANAFVVLPVIKAAGNRHFVYTDTIFADGFTTTNLDSSGNAETNSFYWIAVGPKT